ncbi:Water stress and hypersensitive response domain containing protein [Trema orientale]|uniref:Water stress and hypersensitive response domain containing protein n=1 Tax=Trema orientale TaxID=63057 RepID=A0A2P5F9T4_TREOI|nr:Water stress and hypersensitive response domain containing protein [Trema orientale]
MSSKNDYVVYTPLPSTTTPQNVVVLPYYRPPPVNRRRRLLRQCTCSAAVLLLFSAAVYFLYPSDPTIQLARIHLNRVRVNSSPGLTLDLSFSLTVKVYNRDFFSLDYDKLVVSVGYRGRELGFVSSAGGRIRARGSSYVDATLDLNGFEIIHDVFYLLEDLARGVIPFDTDTLVEGNLGLFFFKIPIKGRVSCEVFVNTSNQTIARQDCYPE